MSGVWKFCYTLDLNACAQRKGSYTDASPRRHRLFIEELCDKVKRFSSSWNIRSERQTYRHIRSVHFRKIRRQIGEIDIRFHNVLESRSCSMENVANTFKGSNL